MLRPLSHILQISLPPRLLRKQTHEVTSVRSLIDLLINGWRQLPRSTTYWIDQTTNAKFVADVWKVGVRVKVNEKGKITKEELVMRVRQVMEKEIGMEIRKASSMWKELAKEAVDEGGSSDKNIEEFVAQLRY